MVVDICEHDSYPSGSMEVNTLIVMPCRPSLEGGDEE